jgi:hypothetical protein
MFASIAFNWKTTLAGFIGGLVPIIQGYLAGTLTAEKVILGVCFLALGILAKDGDKSGVASNPNP